MVVALVLVARLLLPCLPAHAMAGAPGGSDDFFLLCTPNGIVDLRSLDPAAGGFGESAGKNDGEQPSEEPAPADGDTFRTCPGACTFTLSLPLAGDAYGPARLTLGKPLPVLPADLAATSDWLHHSLAARAPPSSQS
ncbi:hypothetical protein [Pelagibius sp.]|uniref:hypothetical protein n=1 Tax=Pelagibius sp. TaxID=1931238 RepID=UPI002602254B|nr:hypothetical protein [Pelagibius sp.]